MTTKEIDHREIRFAIHIPEGKNNPDLHYVKQQIYYKDGTHEPKAFLVKDFKRPIWITKQRYRNHKDFKETEYLERVDELMTTQSNIDRTIANYLNVPHLANNRKELLKSPYIYGYDISSTAYMKYLNLKKNNYMQNPYTYAVFDIEVNVSDTKNSPNPTREDGYIILASLAMKEKDVYKIYIVCHKKFYNDKSATEKVKEKIKQRLPHITNFELTLKIFDNEVDMLKTIFKVANDWAPDFLAIWNMNFDIPYILDRLKYHNVDPRHVLCDTSIPFEYRVCKYKKGTQKKITSSGVVKPIPVSLQWHTLFLTAKFYVIDAMCTYRLLRITSPEKPSYSLDYILKLEKISDGKLKLEEAKEHTGLAYHYYMQREHKEEYIVYNIYDCVSIIELEEKIKDLPYTLPSAASFTDFWYFNRNPKKIVDSFFDFALQEGRVIGNAPSNSKVDSKDDEEDIEIDNENSDEDEEGKEEYDTLSLRGWIVALKQNYLIPDGLKCFNDLPNLKTNIRAMVYDSDVTSAYPNAGRAANVSKETTFRELIRIEGVDEEVFRIQNLGLIVGPVNMIEYCNVMFDLPNSFELDV
jgi:hypothetical protein